MSPEQQEKLDALKMAYDTLESFRRVWCWARKQPAFQDADEAREAHHVYIHLDESFKAAARAVAAVLPLHNLE